MTQKLMVIADLTYDDDTFLSESVLAALIDTVHAAISDYLEGVAEEHSVKVALGVPETPQEFIRRHHATAVATSPAGSSYRGREGCTSPLCSRDGNPDRCYGWHCLYCDGPSNMQGDCSNKECPGA